MEKLKFPWGELIIAGGTNDFSVSIDVVKPGGEPDSKKAYLKKGVAIYYVIKGKGLLSGKQIKKGDLIKIKKGQNFHLENNSKSVLKLLAVYLPPYDDDTVEERK